jgi:hypothetical protein
MHRLIQLSSLVGRLIQFDEPRRRYGEVAKDALIGGGVSAVGTAGILAAAGVGLKRRAPDLSRMLTTAAGQHIKVFNPWHTAPMMRSLPEASRLFGKQLRATKEVENLATRGGVPTFEGIKESYQRSGINPQKDIQDIGAFKDRWGRTPGATMEKSLGLLSGMAATGIGAGGGAVLSKGWQKKEKQFSVARNLFNKVKEIQFKTLYQPGEQDEPPEQLPKFTEGEPIDYTVQQHAAKRAGLHRDIRIGTKRHGLLSWATRKQLPDPGEKIAIHSQPVHPHSYLGWEGNIPAGYGAGQVSTEHVGKALITKSTPTEVHATLADQREHHRLAFVKTPKGWLLARGKHPEPSTEAAKPKYKSVSQEDAPQRLKEIVPGTIVQPKIDGALTYISVGPRPEVFSHRKSEVSGKNVLHTERFFGGRPTLNIPKEHHGKTLLAELYGIRKGKAVPTQELGGILNANLGESLRRQREKKIDLKAMPFDIAGREKAPYPERLAEVKEILRHLPQDKFHAPEEATEPGAARALFEKVRKGRHPLTSEGVIIHPPEGRMIKIKNVQEENVKIHSVFPGKGKFKHGGFYYSDESGQPLGKVGTGFTEETRAELPKYIGRTARVRYQEKFKSGKLRAPSLIAIEENK